jgi:hypothetical protein
MLRQSGHDPDQDVKDIVPPDLRLVQYLAGDAWPEDFVILIGGRAEADGCWPSVDGPHIAGWAFAYWPRNILVDTVMIENLSSQPIRIGGLLGTQLSTPRLRVATPPTLPRTQARIAEMSETLVPGEKLLVPTRITFVPNETFFAIVPDRGQRSNEFHARVGTNGFRGNVSNHGAPSFSFKNYAFGHEMNVSGFVVDGKNVDLNRRPSSNFGDLVVSRETGSCPFLMSWDRQKEEWIDHGKVLDKAPRRELEYSELKTFPGFRGRFRIEEREPEIAYIDQAELTIVLRNGESRQLSPDHRKLAAHDGSYMQLYLAEAIEIEFKLPEGVAEDDVAESQLRLTGYYERYASLMANVEPRKMPGVDRRRVSKSIPVAATASGASAPACPVPAKLDPFSADGL